MARITAVTVVGDALDTYLVKKNIDDVVHPPSYGNTRQFRMGVPIANFDLLTTGLVGRFNPLLF